MDTWPATGYLARSEIEFDIQSDIGYKKDRLPGPIVIRKIGKSKKINKGNFKNALKKEKKFK